jgi:hypothetical protein
MWPYWLLLLLPTLLTLGKLTQKDMPSWSALWWTTFVLLALMIGLRHEVGGDWFNYLRNFDAASGSTLEEALAKQDPAYALLSWLATYLDLGIYAVNAVCALFFTWGLLVFCREQPRPWLAVVVSVPYLITVVAMGYSRQGVAIGLAMLALVALTNGKTFQFVLWVALAATFHKSAVILVPLAVLGGSKNKFFMLIWVSAATALLFVLLLQESVDSLTSGYIEAEYQSSGAIIRIAMNALPAALFLLLRKRFNLPLAQRKFWTWMSLGALAFVALLAISPSSTAVDRVALYWIPLQVYVLSRLPNALGRAEGANVIWVYAVIGYSATVHFVWLLFADHSYAWLPYQFYPWVWLWQ